MTAPYRRQVTVVRRTKGTPDAMGNDTWTEAAQVVPAVVGIVNGSEQDAGRDTAVKRVPVYLPAGTTVSHIDAVVIDGERWEIDGVPTSYEHALTGWRPGVEINCKRVTG